MGSGNETEYQLLLAHDLGLIGDDDYTRLTTQLTQVKKMLSALITRLTANS